MRGGVVIAVALMLGGCTALPVTPTLDEVEDERSRAVTEQWRLAADAATEYLQAEWPEAVYPPLTFDRWVEPEAHAAEVLQCMNQAAGRTTGSIGATGLLVLSPRPVDEPTWVLPVAQMRCSLQLIAWSDLYSSGGPVEQAWVRHQVTVALPACVRRWGAQLEIADIDDAIDASMYPTSRGWAVDPLQSVWSGEPLQSVWLAAQVRHADEATARQIRAMCPDPGRTLTQLGPAEIRS